MLCTCIFFAEIGSFDGEEMLDPPHDPSVDPNDDQGMPYVDDHQEASVERPAPAGAPVLPFARRGRIDARYRMELGNQLSAFIVEAGIRPAHYRDIQANDRLLWMWRGTSCDMYNLMWHVVGATIVVTRLRRTICSYRRSRAMARDG